MFKKAIQGMATGVAGFFVGIIALIGMALSLVASFAVPILVIAFFFHLGPFHKNHETVNSSNPKIAMCSTLNQMTAYAQDHQKVDTPALFLQSISYSNNMLASVKHPPSELSGTLSSGINASSQIIEMLLLRQSGGTLTYEQGVQVQQSLKLWQHTSKTITSWYDSNC